MATKWKPIRTAPMDGRNMAVKCKDGTMGCDSLNGRGPAGSKNEGVNYEWWCFSRSPRTHWTRDKAVMAKFK